MWSGLEHSLCKASILFMAIIKINTKESWLIKRKESRRDLQREVQLPWGQEQVPALVQKGLWCLFQDDCVFLFFFLFVCLFLFFYPSVPADSSVWNNNTLFSSGSLYEYCYQNSFNKKIFKHLCSGPCKIKDNYRWLSANYFSTQKLQLKEYFIMNIQILHACLVTSFMSDSL